ncbi:thioredoxin reductase (NADPH) [Catalinimonas alkaloidigena]|uniref:FAD-dependent oxidoreductase n=1 Tax=Catalinimonas alkaloidigena TaxID=1075417 RepID=UPI0024060FE0|nr:FAD-dependent oxidoreductase [Catalinimonas alkaloidigena]MDF9795246.1 thioredoxin reductase (NADPH) [Catalinimonas alkaloidigena]
MKRPIIFAVDDDPQVLRAISRDLRQQYRKDYRIMSTVNTQDALDALPELKKKGDEVALFISDQRMPDMLGVEMLEKAKAHFPKAKKVLLTAYSDIDAAIKAINEVQLDYYLTKPWDPPEEKLYPIINDLLEAWQMQYIPDYQGIRVIGYQYNPKSHEIKDFLAGNLVPYQWLDIEKSDKARELLQLHQIEEKSLPAVVFEDQSALAKPEINEIAQKIGMKVQAAEPLYDVVIIGAGPAGLAAAVYGGSEGLKTLLIEKRAPGGQAGTSSRIENYLGFPNGLSGADLTRRAISQAKRLGTEFLSPLEVKSLRLQDQYKILTLSDESEIKTKSIIISTGVNYRKLEAEGVHTFTGAGVYYGAATTEANACEDKDIYIVGGGNSAGQAAMYLSNYACKVYILIRKADLSSSMSQYLIDQINQTPTIEVVPHTQVVAAKGNGHLEALTLEDVRTEEKRAVAAAALFIFIGNRPFTDWINLDVIKDKKGFIETGRELMKYESFKKLWKLQREPYLLETSIPGILTAGDVRAGAMNRVASAVGEGAMAIKMVHEYLASI